MIKEANLTVNLLTIYMNGQKRKQEGIDNGNNFIYLFKQGGINMSYGYFKEINNKDPNKETGY